MESSGSQRSSFERSESEKFPMMQRRLRFSRKGKGKAVAGPSGQAGPVDAPGPVGVAGPAASVGEGPPATPQGPVAAGSAATPVTPAPIRKRKKGPGPIEDGRPSRRQPKRTRNRRYGVRIRVVDPITEFSVTCRDCFTK